VIVGLGLVVALVGLPTGTGPATGSQDLTARISQVRSSQLALESSMLSLDRTVRSLKRERVAARKQVRKAEKRVPGMRARHRTARARVSDLKARLAEAQAAVAEAEEEEPDPDLIATVERIKARLRDAERTAGRRAANERRAVRQVRAQQRRVKRIGARIRATAKRRSSVGAALSGQIRAMARLAQQRATAMSTVRPASDGSGFIWPTQGRITQGYGCTGFRLAPRRGNCRHFHGAIDIAGPAGTPVRASAVGVVAYVGWSPLGHGNRAFIVVLGHPGGYETLYGHMLPVRRVRVGQLVTKGTTIGLLGSTGRSTGAHVHWEVSRDFRTLDPRTVLDPAADGVKEQKKQKKQQAKKAKQKKQQAKKAKQKQQQRKAGQQRRNDRDRDEAETIVDRGSDGEGTDGAGTDLAPGRLAIPPVAPWTLVGDPPGLEGSGAWLALESMGPSAGSDTGTGPPGLPDEWWTLQVADDAAPADARVPGMGPRPGRRS
jgi:murein DD-endopeptidase MepM/ murein hydrolase activator NlpD